MTPFRCSWLLASTCPLVGGDRAEGHRCFEFHGGWPEAGTVAKSAANLPQIPQSFGNEASNERPSIHLPYAGVDQDLPRQPQSPRKHQPLVLPRRQDRRAGRERLG